MAKKKAFPKIENPTEILNVSGQKNDALLPSEQKACARYAKQLIGA